MSTQSHQKSPRDVVIVDGLRTPFAKAGTDLQTLHPAELGRVALSELLAKLQLNVQVIDEVITGSVGNPVDAVNISRVVALNAGIPKATSAYTVHRNCASALEAITSGYERIRSGTMDVVMAGGTENMSQYPFLLSKKFNEIYGGLATAKTTGARLGKLWELLSADFKQIWELVSTPPLKKTKFKPVVSVMEGLTDPFVGLNMGQTAEILAKEFQISREEQDQWALRSHLKAAQAQKEGKLGEEITPLFIPPDYSRVVQNDNGPRANQTMEALAKLRPIFDSRTGTVTAGNSCPITDGAAFVCLMSREKAESLGYKPIARIRGYGFAGLEPERMGLGPVYSTPLALKRAGLSMKDIGLVEINEAFAAQVLACQRAFDSDEFASSKLGLSQKVGRIDDQILNVNGGAIALGHPVGATGTRITLTLAKQMKRTGTQFGLATLCIGGGQGGAIILETEA